DFQSIKNGLRSLARPKPATGFLESLRASVAAELRPISSPVFRLVEDRRGWVEAWLMPSAVGTLTSVVFAASLIWGLMATVDGTASTLNASIDPRPGSVFLSAPPERLSMSPFEYANGRL